MKFGAVPTADALGATLAHSLVLGGARFRKGRVLSADDLETLTAHGEVEVVVAQIGPDDVGEDAAADRIGQALKGAHLRLTTAATGRVNLVAVSDGVLRVDAAVIAALNGVDEGLTLATLADYARVAEGQLTGTVKIMPYALPASAVAEGEATLPAPPMAVHPFLGGRARLIMTRTPGFKDTLLTKGQAAVRARLTAIGYTLEVVETVPHAQAPIAEALGGDALDLTLILGASATSDRWDVAPAAVVEAGGAIDRYGMPVDPGNLLFLGALGGAPVVGLPGCARSPALNGVDWVLERLSARLPIGGADIAAMGVGGLLKEMPGRPQPREAGQTP